MLDTPGEVISTLKTLTDYYYLKSNSIVCPKFNLSDISNKEPFRPGFLGDIEKRHELMKRLNKLGEKERKVLLLFYTFSMQVDYIANKLSISQRHCYRIKKKALEDIIKLGTKK